MGGLLKKLASGLLALATLGGIVKTASAEHLRPEQPLQQETTPLSIDRMQFWQNILPSPNLITLSKEEQSFLLTGNAFASENNEEGYLLEQPETLYSTIEKLEKQRMENNFFYRYNLHFDEYLHERVTYDLETAYYHNAINMYTRDRAMWPTLDLYEPFSEYDKERVKYVLGEVGGEAFTRTIRDYPHLRSFEKRLQAYFSPSIRINFSGDQKLVDLDWLDTLLRRDRSETERLIEGHSEGTVILNRNRRQTGRGFIDLGTIIGVQPYVFIRAQNLGFADILRIKYEPFDNNEVKFELGKVISTRWGVLATAKTDEFELPPKSVALSVLYRFPNSRYISLDVNTNLQKNHMVLLKYNILDW